MPQMSPLLWLFLMVMVVVSYCLFIIVNYFIVQSSKMEGFDKINKVNSKNWQW